VWIGKRWLNNRGERGRIDHKIDLPGSLFDFLENAIPEEGDTAEQPILRHPN
jgi:hypothetical protein